MNFLAHFHLSGDEKNLMRGNFIADAVKGKKYLNYPEGIQNGIILHRKIDSFTDSHPVVQDSIGMLQPRYGKYSSVIVDILYDHFLAADWNNYSDQALKEYTHSVYKTLWEEVHLYPFRSQLTLTYMSKSNWLYKYARIKGIDRALKGLSRRASFENNMDEASRELRENYELYHSHFKSFYPDIIEYSRKERGL